MAGVGVQHLEPDVGLGAGLDVLLRVGPVRKGQAPSRLLEPFELLGDDDENECLVAMMIMMR